jgi:hypothetical protein
MAQAALLSPGGRLFEVFRLLARSPSLPLALSLLLSLLVSVGQVAAKVCSDKYRVKNAVSRGAALTQARAHTSKPVTVFRLNCIDDDETGENCGGTCKPCSEGVKGPAQQDTVFCKVPEAVRGASLRNVAVTVEASPGPTDSPYSTRMRTSLKGWESVAVAAVSCISDQSRGFAYGAHDFEWATSFAVTVGSVHTTSLTVDKNTGEIYMTGAMQGALTITGKHIMTRIQMGELTVSPAATIITSCTRAVNTNAAPWLSSHDSCGRTSFIARFSKDGKALYLNKLEVSVDITPGVAQAVITDASFDSTNAQLYVVGYFSDGQMTLTESTTLMACDIDPKTRVSRGTPSGNLAAFAVASTNQRYQEGFLLKYSREGALIWMKAIKAARLPANSGLLVSQLRVKTYKAASENYVYTGTKISKFRTKIYNF